MSERLPSKAGVANIIKVEFTERELSELTNWIGTLAEPRPDTEQAVRMIVRDRIKAVKS